MSDQQPVSRQFRHQHLNIQAKIMIKYSSKIPLYPHQRTPIPWNFRRFWTLPSDGGHNINPHNAKVLPDKNSTTTVFTASRRPLPSNKENRPWIGTRDWTSRPCTILSWGNITTFLVYINLAFLHCWSRMQFERFDRNIPFCLNFLFLSFEIL